MPLSPRHSYNNTELSQHSPDESKDYVDSVLGIKGGEHADEERAGEYQNWSDGPHYKEAQAKHLARNYDKFTPEQIEHMKKHGSSDVKCNLLYNEHIPSEHHNEMYSKWVNDDSDDGYDKDDLTNHLRDENYDRRYDGDWDDLRDEARENAESHYDIHQYISDNDIQVHDDEDVENIMNEHDWSGENPDFDDKAEEDPDENPATINYDDNQRYDRTDHPDFEDRHERAEIKATRDAYDNGIPDHIYEGYSEAIQENVDNEFDELWKDKSDGFHESYDNLPDHLHGKLDYLNNIEEHKKKAEAKKLLEKEQKEASQMDAHAANRPRTHEYGKGQHHLEMMKAFADANGGAIDTGRMNKVYPGLKDQWKEHFGDKGKLSSDEIQKKIDTLPKTKYNISYGLWGEHQAQNVNNQQQMVVRLDHTPESYDAIKSKSPAHADLFDKLQKASRMSGHPSNPDTIGWARMDLNDKKHHFLDEMQTDFSKAARNQLEAAGQTEHIPTIKDIEDNHSVWREALMNFVTKFARTNGATKLSTHSPESKASHTGADSVHSVYKEAYKQAPRSMGFKSAEYSDLPLTAAGKKEFQPSDAEKTKAMLTHIEAIKHHMSHALKHTDESVINFGNAKCGIHKDIADQHTDIARKHFNCLKQINPGTTLTMDDAFSHGVYGKAANEIETTPFTITPHANDKLLASPTKILPPYSGHSLDLTPAFALQKSAAWMPDFDDLIKVEDDEPMSGMNSVVGALKNHRSKDTDANVANLKMYEQNPKNVMPGDMFTELCGTNGLTKDEIKRTISYANTPQFKEKFAEGLYGMRHIVSQNSFDADHVDQVMKNPHMVQHFGQLLATDPKSKLNSLIKPKHADALFNSVEDGYKEPLASQLLDHITSLGITTHIARNVHKKHMDDRQERIMEALSQSPNFKTEHINQMMGSEHNLYKGIALGHPKMTSGMIDEHLKNPPTAEYGSDSDLFNNMFKNPNITHDQLKSFMKPLIGVKDAHSNIATSEELIQNYDFDHINGMFQALDHPNFKPEYKSELLDNSSNTAIASHIAYDHSHPIELADKIVKNFHHDDTTINRLLTRKDAKPEWFDQLFMNRAGNKLPVSFYASPKCHEHHLDRLFNSNHEEGNYWDIDRALNKNPNITDEHITKALVSKDRYVRRSAMEAARKHGLYEDPDKVSFAFGTTKLRDARALAESNVDKKVHKKDLEKAGLSPQGLGITHLQDATGHISHKDISDHIGKQPHMTYGYSHASYGDDKTSEMEELEREYDEDFNPRKYGVQFHHFYEDSAYDNPEETDPNERKLKNFPIELGFKHNTEQYNEAIKKAKKEHEVKFKQKHSDTINELYEQNLESQQHNLEPSNAFQLNLTKDHFKQMKEQGVFQKFKEMHSASHSSGHPAAEGSGIGWVRYTNRPDGMHIDEIQSDFGQSFAKQAKGQLDQKVAAGEMSKEEADKHHEDFKRKFPEDTYQKIRNIVFGDKHPNEVLHEAFHQHLRESGHAGKPIHIWHEDAKAPISGMHEEDDPNPVWMKQTYNQTPKKMGYKPAKYGELKTQDNPQLQNSPTWAHTLKKARSVLNTLNKTLGKKN